LRRLIPAVMAIAMPIAFLSGCTSADFRPPLCSDTGASLFVLEAQSVPSATLLPCFSQLPVGWTYTGDYLIKDGLSRYWLDSDRAGVHAAEIELTRTCDTSGAVVIPAAPGESVTILEKPLSLPPSFASVRFLQFPGGCVAERFKFSGAAPATTSLEVEQAVSFVKRQVIVDRVKATLDLKLCGAGAPPCEG
jgi:hypothetical protein